MKEKNHYYNPLINEVLKDKEKIEKGSRIIEKKPRNNLCYTFYRLYPAVSSSMDMAYLSRNLLFQETLIFSWSFLLDLERKEKGQINMLQT